MYNPTSAQIALGCIILLGYSELLIKLANKLRRPVDSFGICLFLFYTILVGSYLVSALILGFIFLIFQDQISLWILQTLFAPIIILFYIADF